jgi:hypothetical protein
MNWQADEMEQGSTGRVSSQLQENRNKGHTSRGSQGLLGSTSVRRREGACGGGEGKQVVAESLEGRGLRGLGGKI